jgi:lysophospholipase L1-like esterase
VITKATVCHAALSLALVAAAQAADDLPEFLDKVQLWNFDGHEPTPDGTGVSVYRLPAEIRGALSEAGAKQMVHASRSEIRFVLKEGAKLEDVTIHLKSNRNTTVMFYRGDQLCGMTILKDKKGAEPYIPPSLVGKTSGPGFPDKACEIALQPAKLKPPPANAGDGPAGPMPAKRFPEHVCRVLLGGGVITLTGIEGDIRPPAPEELPPMLVSYGTSISQGAAASRPDRSFTSLTAAALGHDLRNLGCSGSAFLEPELAEYLAKQPGDLFLFEISVNMAGKGFTVEEFRNRATALIDKVATAHPDVPVVCISILTLGKGGRKDAKPGPIPAFRQALEEICRETPHKNVHFVDGTQLLSVSGLAKDNIHPTDVGMAEIATKLTARLQPLVSDRARSGGAPTREPTPQP